MESGSGLDLLMKASRFVENQQGSVSNGIRTSNSPLRNHIDDVIKQNGHSDHVAATQRAPITTAHEAVSHNRSNKQANSRRASDQDDKSAKREVMRLHHSNELSAADETASMSQYNRNISNGVLPRMYAEEKHTNSGYCSSASPMRSPPRKRSSSPGSRIDSEQRGKMHVPATHSLNAFGVPGAHQVAQLPANPLIPFVHPLMSNVDPVLYADALARQSLANSEAIRARASPAATASNPTSIDSISPQGLPRLMYPLSANPALLMGPRAPAASSYALSDIPMIFSPHLAAAAYGPTAGLLPQQLASWPAIEGMAGLAPGQPIPAQFLAANPFLRNLLSVSDLSALKDANRGLQKPTVPSAVRFTGDMMKYPDALAVEALKQECALSARSMSPRKSLSPDCVKKTTVPSHHPSTIPFTPAMLNATSLTKSPIPDWKFPPSTTSRASKSEAGQPNFDSRVTTALRRDLGYGDNHEPQVKVEEAKQKLLGFTQKPNSSSDIYGHRLTTHDRQSPCTDRWENRRHSRDFSPHLSPVTGEKSAKKRPHEGIPRDLIPPDIKPQSSVGQSSFPGVRHSKSPARPPCKSPMDQHGGNQSSSASNYFVPPYYLHPSISSLPFTLPAASYLCPPDMTTASTSKPVVDPFTAATLGQATVAGSQLFRPPLPQEPALSDLARLTGLSPYLSFLQPHQWQQALKAMSPSTTNSEYVAAMKHQMALPQGLAMDGRVLDGSASPSQLNSAHRRFMAAQTHSPAPPVLANPSPIPPQSKPAPKQNPIHSLNHIYNTQPVTSTLEALERSVKHETTSPSGKYAASSPQLSSAKSSSGSLRHSEDDRGVPSKRRAAEEMNDRAFKESAIKRKREQTTDVDEHFRRSLGSDYKEETRNKVHITGEVDEHFAKSLGDILWSKFKTVGGSPNGREAQPTTTAPSATHPGLPPYPGSLYYHPMSGLPEPREMASFASHALLANSGSKATKPNSHPELTSDPPAMSRASLPLDDARVLNPVKRSPVPYPDSRSLLPGYENAARLQAEAKDSPMRLLAASPVDGKVKKHNGPSRVATSPLHPEIPYHVSATLVPQVSPQAVAAANTLLKSPAKTPVLPAYSQPNNASEASPKQKIDRQSSGESMTTPVSVQS